VTRSAASSRDGVECQSIGFIENESIGAPPSDSGSISGNNSPPIATPVEDLPEASEAQMHHEDRKIANRKRCPKSNVNTAVCLVGTFMAAAVIAGALAHTTFKRKRAHAHGTNNTNMNQATNDLTNVNLSQPNIETGASFCPLLPNCTLQASQDPNSPQARACQWLLQDHDHNQHHANHTNARRLQCFALATLHCTALKAAGLLSCL